MKQTDANCLNHNCPIKTNCARFGQGDRYTTMFYPKREQKSGIVRCDYFKQKRRGNSE